MTRLFLNGGTRRQFLAGSAALVASPALSQVAPEPEEEQAYDPLRPPPEPEPPVKRNISAFRAKRWHGIR